MNKIDLNALKIGSRVDIYNKNYTVDGGSCNKCALYKASCGLISSCNNRILKEVYENENNPFEQITSSIAKVLTEKNKRYGGAALEPLDIFAKHHPYGSRLDEKLARVKNSDTLRKNDVFDLLGGLVLICKDKDWTNFEDQID